MSLRRIEGVVLRVRPFSETSLVASLFSREVGKVSLIAKGARRPRSSTGGVLQLFHVVRCVLYFSEKQTLRVLREGQVVATHDAIPLHPEVFGLASYGAELVLTQTPEEEPAPGVYWLLRRFLGSLNRCTPPEAHTVRLWFDFQLQKLVGYGLRIEACVACGRPVAPPLVVDAARGGVVCPSCGPHGSCLVELQEADSVALRVLLTHPSGVGELPSGTSSRLLALARTVWELHAPRVPVRSLAFLAELGSGAYGSRG